MIACDVTGARVTVPTVAAGPAPSEKVAAASESPSVNVSSSTTVNGRDASACSAAVTVSVVATSASTNGSSTVTTANATDGSPAGIVTEAGNRNWPGAVETTLTVRDDDVTGSRVTRAGTLAPSPISAASNASVNRGTSTSVTVTCLVTLAKAVAAMVTVARRSPATTPSAAGVAWNVTLACPAGIMTLDGTANAEGAELVNVTAKSAERSPLRVTVYVSGAPFSGTDAAPPVTVSVQGTVTTAADTPTLSDSLDSATALPVSVATSR